MQEQYLFQRHDHLSEGQRRVLVDVVHEANDVLASRHPRTLDPVDEKFHVRNAVQVAIERVDHDGIGGLVNKNEAIVIERVLGRHNDRH